MIDGRTMSRINRRARVIAMEGIVIAVQEKRKEEWRRDEKRREREEILSDELDSVWRKESRFKLKLKLRITTRRGM